MVFVSGRASTAIPLVFRPLAISLRGWSAKAATRPTLRALSTSRTTVARQGDSGKWARAGYLDLPVETIVKDVEDLAWGVKSSLGERGGGDVGCR